MFSWLPYYFVSQPLHNRVTLRVREQIYRVEGWQGMTDWVTLNINMMLKHRTCSQIQFYALPMSMGSGSDPQKAHAKPPISIIQLPFYQLHLYILLSAFIPSVISVTGAAGPTHKFRFFFFFFGVSRQPMAARLERRLVGFGVMVGHLCQSQRPEEELKGSEVCPRNTSRRRHTVSNSGSNGMSVLLYTV